MWWEGLDWDESIPTAPRTFPMNTTGIQGSFPSSGGDGTVAALMEFHGFSWLLLEFLVEFLLGMHSWSWEDQEIKDI